MLSAAKRHGKEDSMNLKRTSIFTLALSLGLVTAGFAGATGKGEGKERQGRKWTRIMKMDGNQDGRVTMDEVQDKHRTRIEKAFSTGDLNQDGLLDRTELKALKKARHGAKKARRKGAKHHAKKGKRFARMDADGDGLLSRAEMTQGLAKKANRIFKRLDTNADGAIELAELENKQ